MFSVFNLAVINWSFRSFIRFYIIMTKWGNQISVMQLSHKMLISTCLNSSVKPSLEPPDPLIWCHTLKNASIPSLLSPPHLRYHLLKSTFILKHWVCLVMTASVGRGWAVTAVNWDLKKKKKEAINNPTAGTQRNLTINPAVCSAQTCLGCQMQWEWMDRSAVNLGYDSRGEIDLNGDGSWSH